MTPSLWSSGVVGTLAVIEPPAGDHHRVGEGAADVHAHQGAFRVDPSALSSPRLYRGDPVPPAPRLLPDCPRARRRARRRRSAARRRPPAACSPPRRSLLSPGPPNGDLSGGPRRGGSARAASRRRSSAPGARIARQRDPGVAAARACPPGAQTLRGRAARPGGDGLVIVSARPVDGGPEVELGTLEPGTARRAWPVGVGARRRPRGADRARPGPRPRHQRRAVRGRAR